MHNLRGRADSFIFPHHLSPELEIASNFSECLTSPFGNSPFDDDLLAMPAIGSVDIRADILTSPIMDWNGGLYNDRPLFNRTSRQDLMPMMTCQPIAGHCRNQYPTVVAVMAKMRFLSGKRLYACFFRRLIHTYSFLKYSRIVKQGTYISQVRPLSQLFWAFLANHN